VRALFIHYIKDHIENYAHYRASPLPWLIESNTFSSMTGSSAPQISMRFVSARRPSLNQDFQSRLTMTWMQPISFRFLAPQIADTIYGKYFNGKRKLRMLDPEFINRTNGTMLCLTCTILCHQLYAYQLGVYQDPPDFKHDAVGGSRPSISPMSLVFVLMTNQSCKPFSYGRRTPAEESA